MADYWKKEKKKSSNVKGSKELEENKWRLMKNSYYTSYLL